MSKSLFDLSLTEVCRNCLCSDLEWLPCDCKQRLLEFITSHDQINTKRCISLLSRPLFGINLTRLHFYLSNQLTDEILDTLTSYSQVLQQIIIIECDQITDQGIISVTMNQKRLLQLELRCMRNLTSNGLKFVKSPLLHTVDLSGCTQITSQGIFYLVFNNPSIRNLSLSYCLGLDDQALYDIAHGIGERLETLELDFLHNSRMLERSAAIRNLCQQCPNISQLSLCGFFGCLDEIIDPMEEGCDIEGAAALRQVDLYANYFSTLPHLPLTIRSIRLSVSGQENVLDLVRKLSQQTYLMTIHLQLSCPDEAIQSIESANNFLCHFISLMGPKITSLHVTIYRLNDMALSLITKSVPHLAHLALDVAHVSVYHLRRFFSGGKWSPGARLKSLKLSGLHITYRTLFAIGRGAISLTDLETSHMSSVDDRFLALLADNCKHLTNVNFNGCKFVTDKGMSALARKCPLKEVRIRGTACTDISLMVLGQFCPAVEWIAHADFSGSPKFTEAALKSLRDACIQRVIC